MWGTSGVGAPWCHPMVRGKNHPSLWSEGPWEADMVSHDASGQTGLTSLEGEFPLDLSHTSMGVSHDQGKGTDS